MYSSVLNISINDYIISIQHWNAMDEQNNTGPWIANWQEDTKYE